MRQSIFRMTLYSSPQVHRALGSNRCRFSLAYVSRLSGIQAAALTSHREVYTEVQYQRYRRRLAVGR